MPSSPVIESVPSNHRSSGHVVRAPQTPRPLRPVRLLAAAGAVAVGLAGCSLRMPTPYSPPLQQGNVIEQDALSKLKPGMTRAQVRFLLGTPLVVDVFRNDRWDYVYFLRRQGEAPQQRRVTVIFDGEQLARVEGDVVAGSGTVPPSPAAKADAARAQAAKADAAKAAAAKDAAPGAAPARADKSPAAAAQQAPVKPDAPPQRGFFGRMLDRIGF